ncbi:hypothetical protein CONPUDRAFT_70628 [Coniophora puteana RWD-64-598 SS2]|uniref:Uncharacterized protein n=1 Tax=Coniophora puteana (strain RWD-64-598) TaxID=741705 RepID=A0A5M3MXZ9_CONPW|nr:uncharacterized protein CONPUDRAFT_70628 [Coniophora puteana RWD-64-598 SS2]EIW83654.1 hypothetical protein CONPUDRAFT_70628 [Coniophora puteana RWD-64-598 SS2]
MAPQPQRPSNADTSSGPLLNDGRWWHDSLPVLPLTPNRREDEKSYDTRQGRLNTSEDNIKRYFTRISTRGSTDSEGTWAGSSATVLGLSIGALKTLCHSLHLLLVILHVILVVVYIPHLEYNSIVSITSVHIKLPTVLSLYSTILVTMTQRLGLLRTLHRKPKLTTLADASNAWSGIGSALVGLWHNLRMPAGVLSSVVIAVYLACALVLHVVSSSIMSLEPFNQTTTAFVSSRISWPGANASLSGIGDSDEGAPDWQTIAALVPGVQRLNAYSTQGLNGTTVYDTLQLPNSATGTAQVNATTVGFKCGLVPKANVSTFAQSTSTALMWNGWIDEVPFVTPWTDQVLFSPQMSGLIAGTSVDVMFMTTAGLSSDVSLNDTYGVSMNYPYVAGLVTADNPTGSITNKTIQMFFVGCSMTATHSIVDVDVQTNTLQNSPTGAEDTIDGAWSGLPDDGNYTEATEPGQVIPGEPVGIIPSWQTVPGTPTEARDWLWLALSEAPLSNITITNGNSQSYTVSLIDYYLMQQLGIFIAYSPTTLTDMSVSEPPDPRFSLNVTSFENILATIAASMLWTASQITDGGYVPETGLVEVSQYLLVWRLTINLTPGRETLMVTSVGMLEMLWLAEREPPLRARFDDVDQPTTDNLRAAVNLYAQRQPGATIILEDLGRKVRITKEDGAQRAPQTAEAERKGLNMTRSQEVKGRSCRRWTREPRSLTHLLSSPREPMLTGALVSQSWTFPLVSLEGVVAQETASAFNVVVPKDQLEHILDQNTILVLSVSLNASSPQASPRQNQNPARSTHARPITARKLLHSGSQLYENQFYMGSAERTGKNFKAKGSIEF